MTKKITISDLSLSIILAVPNPIIRKGIEHLLLINYYVSSIKPYACLKEVDEFEGANIIIFEPKEREDYKIIRELQIRYKKLKMILYSSQKLLSPNFLFATKNKEIDAFVYEFVNENQFIEVIEEIFSRTSKRTETIYFPPKISDTFFTDRVTDPILFSVRELAILDLISEGKTTVEIGKALGISQSTVATFRTLMMQKFNAKNIIPVLMYAVSMNYLPRKIIEE